jgi:hypothetical protein
LPKVELRGKTGLSDFLPDQAALLERKVRVRERKVPQMRRDLR